MSKIDDRLARLERLTRKDGPLVAICSFPLLGPGRGLYVARYGDREHHFTDEAAMLAHLEGHNVSIGLYVPGQCTDEEWLEAADNFNTL